MARTHYTQRSPTDTVKRFGWTVGNYVTHRLTARVAVGVGETETLVDRITIFPNFRISQLSVDALGLTANVTAIVAKNAAANVVASIDADTGTPKVVAPASLANRDFAQGDTLDLYITTDGTGVAPAGSIVIFVHGYFTDHITRKYPWAERGQRRPGAPIAGCYDLFPLINLRANANQAERVECSIIAPYAGRVMRVGYDLRSHTETTGAITGRIRLATVGAHTALDWDVNEQFIVDPTTTPALTGRDFAKGDVIDLAVASGAVDTVPISGASAHVLVWCKGHIAVAEEDD